MCHGSWIMAYSYEHVGDKEKFFVLRSFVSSDEAQRIIAEEALSCHYRNEEFQGIKTDASAVEIFTATSKSSLKLNLGISCGGDLSNNLPNSVAVVRRGFEHAANMTKNQNIAKTLQMIALGPLSGLSLLYGVNATMLPHYDSPTQPGQREEWLCMISIGNTMVFRCDKETIMIESGDVIVMDAMATLHGVEQIIPDVSVPPVCSRLRLPIRQVRLGILLWQGRRRLSLDCNDVVHPIVEINLGGGICLFEGDNDD